MTGPTPPGPVLTFVRADYLLGEDSRRTMFAVDRPTAMLAIYRKHKLAVTDFRDARDKADLAIAIRDEAERYRAADATAGAW